MPVITLTSDYGLQDPYLAAVKGALYSLLPDVTLCDISHQIEPGNLMQAQFIFKSSYNFFPPGTVHLVLVKEIVRSKRWLAAKIKDQFIITSDSGFLSLLTTQTRPAEVIEISLPQEQPLFPGRDFLAKAATHLARGGALSMIGRTTEKWALSTLPKQFYESERNRMVGHVIYIDNFGNVVTNITWAEFSRYAGQQQVRIDLPGRQTISAILSNYHEARAGEIIALFGAEGHLELALVEPRGKQFNGANSMLGLNIGNTLTVTFT